MSCHKHCSYHRPKHPSHCGGKCKKCGKNDRRHDCKPNPLTQSQWEIRRVTGDDENSGLPGCPIRTIAEFNRRIGRNNILNPDPTPLTFLTPLPFVENHAVVTITIFNEGEPDLQDSFGINTEIVKGGYIHVIGGDVPTVKRSGTAANITPVNVIANQRWVIFDAGASAADLNKRIQFTSGTAGPNALFAGSSGATAFVAQVTPGVSLTLSDIQVNTGFPNVIQVPLTPSVGDAYVVQEITKITGSSVNLLVQGNSSFLQRSIAAETGIYFTDLNVTTEELSPVSPNFIGSWPLNGSGDTTFHFESCILEVMFVFFAGNVILSNTAQYSPGDPFFGGLTLHPGAFLTQLGGLIKGTRVSLLNGSLFAQDNNAMLDTSGIIGHGKMNLGLCCSFNAINITSLFDSCGDGYLVLGNWHAEPAFVGVSHVWGAGNAGVGVRVCAGGVFGYGGALGPASMSVMGAQGDFALNGPNAIPPYDGSNFDPVTGLYSSTAILCSWPNLAAPLPAGFGGSAINPQNGAVVAPLWS